MTRKLQFYERYGVEEYYIYDPDENELEGLQRQEGERLELIEEINHWKSPRLGIEFVLTSETMEIYRPDGRKFLSSLELEQQRQQATQRAERLAEQLRALGIDPKA